MKRKISEFAVFTTREAHYLAKPTRGWWDKDQRDKFWGRNFCEASDRMQMELDYLTPGNELLEITRG